LEAEKNEHLASAIRFLPEAVALTKTSAGMERISFANESFQQLTGYTFEEMQGRDMTLLQGPETDPASLRRLLCPPANEESWQLELVLYRKDGAPFWDKVSVRGFPSGDNVCHVQTHTDITRRKELENLLILSQKREAAGHLVSGISHDFNNLLTAIMAYTGLMTSRVSGDSQIARYIHEIQAAAQRGAQLVTQLLDLERQDTAEPVEVDPGELAEGMHDLMQRVLGENIRLRIEKQGPPGRIRAPLGRLQQVLLNLGINARDAMPAGGDLIFRLTTVKLDAESAAGYRGATEGEYVLLSVSDNGAGMDAETLSHIFKPFFTTKGRGKGSGLGLFTVDTIIRLIGGYLAVESAPGRGTTFRILLPVAGEFTGNPGPKRHALNA